MYIMFPAVDLVRSEAALSERDVCVAWVYAPAVLVLHHCTQSRQRPTHAQLLVHTCVRYE